METISMQFISLLEKTNSIPKEKKKKERSFWQANLAKAKPFIDPHKNDRNLYVHYHMSLKQFFVFLKNANEMIAF